MKIVSCDFRPRWQQVSVFDRETGEINEYKLTNGREYQARCHHKPKGVAKVAAARKLAVRLYWMLRQNLGYPEIARIESSSKVALAGNRHTDDLIEHSRTPC